MSIQEILKKDTIIVKCNQSVKEFITSSLNNKINVFTQQSSSFQYESFLEQIKQILSDSHPIHTGLNLVISLIPPDTLKLILSKQNKTKIWETRSTLDTLLLSCALKSANEEKVLLKELIEKQNQLLEKEKELSKKEKENWQLQLEKQTLITESTLLKQSLNKLQEESHIVRLRKEAYKRKRETKEKKSKKQKKGSESESESESESKSENESEKEQSQKMPAHKLAKFNLNIDQSPSIWNPKENWLEKKKGWRLRWQFSKTSPYRSITISQKYSNGEQIKNMLFEKLKQRL